MLNRRNARSTPAAPGSRGLYGVVAEFTDAEALTEAAKKAYAAGYRRMDAYSPYAIEEVQEAIGFNRTSVPLLTLIGAAIGGGSGFLLQWWTMAVNYPMNVGGRPLNSWQSFIPITFELAILFAGFAATFGMLGLNGFPQPYHPLFNVPAFQRASIDRFFLCIEARDPQFDQGRTREFLASLAPVSVAEVEK